MRLTLRRASALLLLVAALSSAARAQTTDARKPQEPAPSSATPAAPTGGLFGVEEVRRQVREQRELIEELRAALEEQTRLIGELRKRVEQAEQAALRGAGAHVREAAYARASGGAAEPATNGETASAAQAPAAARTSETQTEARVRTLEDQVKKSSDALKKNQLGSLTFGGDLRFRYESFYGQQNSLASSDQAGALGNPLSTRQRLRMRARFFVRGKVGDEFEWGIRLATGSFADMISTNQTLTDFFTRKNFALDHAFITFRPKQIAGFQVQAGKFDTPWTRTEMTWDGDISVEGLSESYTRESKTGTFRKLGLLAWQLPMLERNSAFVLGADGRVDLAASGRAGRDLALYGAQALAEIAASKNVMLKLYASDLYFSGTQFITPAQFFNGNIQFPVTFTVPASGTTPARTITTQVSVPRNMLVSGNSNLGLSLANTNAVNRDGRLSSGFNLVDLIARAEFNHSERWPVVLLFNFVTNTQTHDVVTAGPTGADLLLPNDEGQGYWAEFQIGKDVLRLPFDKVARGDLMFNYTLTRIEKDAILSPFNGGDLGIQTDVRVNRFMFAYALHPQVALSVTAFVTQRPTGLLGAFGQTPPGSLNRALKRVQLDTVLRF